MQKKVQVYAIRHEGIIIYIGNTGTPIEKRFQDHIYRARINSHRHCRKLNDHMRTNNYTGYSYEWLENTTEDLRYEREKYWIKKFNTRENGCNSTLGGISAVGEDHYMWGREHKPETKEKIRIAHTGRPLKEAHKEAIRKANLNIDRTSVSHRVKCITTGQEFKSIVECADHYKVTMFTIQMILRGKSNPDKRRKLKGLEFVRIE